ncbi:MAG: hypothetical protein WCS52_12100 [bacterium]
MNTVTFLSKSILGLLFGVILLAGGLTARATTSVWLDATTGIWTNPARWVGGVAPVSTNDISINVDGDYSSQWKNDIQRIDVGAIDIGTTTGSGTHTLLLTGSAIQRAGINGPITVGPHGVFEQMMELSSLSTALTEAASVTIRSGGVWKSTSTDDRQWSAGKDRTFAIDAGGRVEIGAASGFTFGTIDYSPFLFTNNGTITGPGRLNAIAGSAKVAITGSGTIDGPGLLYIRYNSSVTFGGTLTCNRTLIQTDPPNMGSIYFMDGANVTMNGDMVWTNVQRAFHVQTSGASAVVGGAGVVDITFNNVASSFGGKDNSQTGTNLLAGTGRLFLRTAGNTVDQYFNLFILSRTGAVSGAGGMYRINYGRSMLISGVNGCFAMGAGTTLHVARDVTYTSHSYLRIHNGGTLSMSGARMEGYAADSDPYAFHFSDDQSAATFDIVANTTNTVTGAALDQTLKMRLGTNAVVNVGANSMMTLSNAVLHVAMTNSAQWGWAAQGTLAIGTNVQMEALSTDHGYNVSVADEPFSINRLAFVSDNSTLTLTNSVGAGKKALYVKNLDLSALSPGATVNLQGFSGAERVFYSNLLNPNNATFVTPAEWVLIPSEATMIIIM